VKVVSEQVSLFKAEDVYVPATQFPPALHPGSEYDQFLRSLALNENSEPLPPEVEVQFAITPILTKTWTFQISGGSPLGGASFAVQTQSEGNTTLGSCVTTDNFNGTYTVSCAPTRSNDGVLTVELNHLSFGAFTPFGHERFVQQKLKQPLFECRYTVPAGAARARPDCAHSFAATATDTERFGGWWTEFRSEQPQHFPTNWCAQETATDLKRCMAGFTNVYMYGESHMRFFYDYLLAKLERPNGHLEVKHSDDTSGNVHYFATHYITRGPEGGVMIDALRNTSFANGSLILISYGSWHLHGMGLAKTIADVKDVLVPQLKRILTTAKVKVLVFTGPAKFKQEGPWAGIENTASMAALLEATQLLMPLEISVLDIVHPTRGFMETVTPPVQWDCDRDGQCQCHILCRLGGSSNVTGRFGKEIFREIVHQACLDY
jgi:hypothetical protein